MYVYIYIGGQRGGSGTDRRGGQAQERGPGVGREGYCLRCAVKGGALLNYSNKIYDNIYENNTCIYVYVYIYIHTYTYTYTYTDIGAKYGKGSARGAIAYLKIIYIINYIIENNCYNYIYRSRVWQSKRARNYRRYWRSWMPRRSSAKTKMLCCRIRMRCCRSILMHVIVIFFLEL